MKEPHEMRPGNRYARDAEARRALGDLVENRTSSPCVGDANIGDCCFRRRSPANSARSSKSLTSGNAFAAADAVDMQPLLSREPEVGA
jgi:hypothetical protein